MSALTLDAMLLLFLAAAVTTVWRWRAENNGVHMARFAIFSGGVLFYAWLQSPLYDESLSRWMVRALLLALVMPEILENLEIIREERSKKKSG